VTLGTTRNAEGIPWKSLGWWQKLGYTVTGDEENAYTRSIGVGVRVCPRSSQAPAVGLFRRAAGDSHTRPKAGQPSWRLRADCPTCGTFLKYLPKDEPGPNTPNVDKLIVLLGRVALSRRAAELDGWAERQVPRLTKLLDDLVK
jgi:hypothetical protein